MCGRHRGARLRPERAQPVHRARLTFLNCFKKNKKGFLLFQVLRRGLTVLPRLASHSQAILLPQPPGKRGPQELLDVQQEQQVWCGEATSSPPVPVVQPHWHVANPLAATRSVSLGLRRSGPFKRCGAGCGSGLGTWRHARPRVPFRHRWVTPLRMGTQPTLASYLALPLSLVRAKAAPALGLQISQVTLSSLWSSCSGTVTATRWH